MAVMVKFLHVIFQYQIDTLVYFFYSQYSGCGTFFNPQSKGYGTQPIPCSSPLPHHGKLSSVDQVSGSIAIGYL